MMKKRLFAMLAMLALVIICAAVAVSANTSGTTPVAFNEATDRCPCCNQIVTQWTALPAITSATTSNKNLSAGHYIVEEDMDFSSLSYYYNVTGAKKVVILFKATVTGANGKNVFRFGMTGTNALECQGYFLGGQGGRITGTGMSSASATTNGSLMRIGGYGKLTIDGDLTIESSGTVTSGGMGGLFDVIGGEVIMNDGTLNGITSTSTVDTYGAVITRYHDSLSKAGKFTMNGGTINGGTVTKGGAIYNVKGEVIIQGTAVINGGTTTSGGAIYANNGTTTISGGTVNGGIATSGGAVYVAEGATFTMTSGTINGTQITDATTTTVNGGAIYSVATGNNAVQLNGGTINGGTVARAANSGKGITALKGRGGAIYINGGKVTLGGTDVVGGRAHEGGCVYVNAGTLDMTAGSMSGGDALSNGGTVFLKGTMNMSGGTVTANPNNTYAYSKGIRIVNGTLNLSGTAHVISAGGSEGNAIYVVTGSKSGLAKLTLAGQAKVTNPNGSQNHNIFMSNYEQYPSKLEVKAGWTGTASVKFGYIYGGNYAAPGATYSVGMAFPAEYAAGTGDFDGKLYMELADDLPTIHWDGATGLKASDVQICVKEGVTTQISWFKDSAAAVQAYTEGYIKLYNDMPVNLSGKEVYVDFNGCCSEVTLAGGKLYGFDSTSGAAAPGTAEVTVTDGQAESFAQNLVTGDNSVALISGGKTTFHTVKVHISAVNLRPGNAGLYYSAQFACDDVLKEYVDAFGVAVSLDDMPGEDFATDAKTLYTSFGKEKLTDGDANSVLIRDVMKQSLTADANKERAQMQVYANAYLQLTTGGQTTLILADNPYRLSFKSVMQRVNAAWITLPETDKTNVIGSIYTPYVEQFSENDWNLFHIQAAKEGVPMNKELKILTIGNSLSVDAGRMLAYVAQQEGSQGIKVGTLYKANCSVQEHADFLTNNKPNYWYYESGFDAQNPGTLTAGSLVPSETKNYVGYDAIVAEDWDIIVMQHSVFGAGKPETYDASIGTIIDYVNAHKTNPNAVFVWNMTWMPPVDAELLSTAEVAGRSPGFSKSYISYTKDPLDREAQTMMYEMITGAVEEKIATDSRFVYVLPSATMMHNALTATSDKVMYRDYIHGSDYGRLMNAYLWYSMFTGKTITEPAVDTIPGALRYASADQRSDLVLTRRMQDVLVESVHNAIADPFQLTVSQYQKEASLKVLAIGNSFSQDAMRHLEEIARSEGYADIKLGNLYIGGSSLKTNWTKAEGDLADYTYYFNYDGNWKKTANYKISQAMADQDWDIVTLQQASGNSGQTSTFEPYLENLIGYIQENEPGAKILWHMTWAYAQDSTHSSFPNYNSNQMTMYEAIVNATQSVVVPYQTAGTIEKIIPSGTAIQNARTSYVGDHFNRDGYHLNLMGRIVAACTWYSVLTEEELTELTVSYFADSELSGDPSVTLTQQDKTMILEAVNKALESPYEITAFTEE